MMRFIFRSSPFASRRSFRDDRGVATLEGILVFAVLAGVLLGVVLLGQWGTRLQYAQMGARLLTFNAGDAALAKFSRTGDSATLVASTTSWNTLVDSVPADWLDVMLGSHSNDRLAGRVKGTQRGRLPSQGPSMFDFTSASVGYFSHSSAASNPWADTTTNVERTFLGIAYWVAYNESTPQALDHIPTPPPSGLPLLETVYTRVGVK